MDAGSFHARIMLLPAGNPHSLTRPHRKSLPFYHAIVQPEFETGFLHDRHRSSAH